MGVSSKRIRRACVIGAGVMGSGIASHLANAGVSCLLLDVDLKLAQVGLQNALKLKPAPLFTQATAALIQVGSLDADLDKIRDCDWVIEVVVENIDIKRSLFARMEPLLSPTAIVSSNTSGLQIKDMVQGRSDAFQSRFLVTHFFNPVRYLHLLEIIAGPKTDPEIVKQIAAFAENQLGKGVVYGYDTPNFVANRIGVFAMMECMQLMQSGGYSIEEVDAVFGPALGRPKSAVFRTADVVGLDTLVHVAKNCYSSSPNDEKRDTFRIPEFLTKMVDNKWLGQKSKQGFYKKEGDAILALDYKRMTYQPKSKVRFESLGAIRQMEELADKIRLVCQAEDKAGQLAWKVLSSTCIYAANRLYEIAPSIVDIDNALKWGFGWELGAFETWDVLGVRSAAKRMREEGQVIPAWVDKMLEAGRESFYMTDSNGNLNYWDAKQSKPVSLTENPKMMSIASVKRKPTHIVKDAYATTLLDLGDGVLCCEFHTKMNAIDGDVMQGMEEALDLCESGQFQALVIANDGPNFSAGANLLLLYLAAQQEAWTDIDAMIKRFQGVTSRLRYSPIPTVAAPFQLTLGGGAEVSMWCNRMRPHAELYMGLVEVGVGLIPGGGGTVEMMARAIYNAVDDPTYPIESMLRRGLETVAMAKVSTSAEEARKLMYLWPSNGIVMNRRQLLYSAKQEALGMANAGFRAPSPRSFRLPGKSAYATFDMALSTMRDGGFMSDHDLKVSLKVAHVMTGGDCSPRVPVSEQTLLDLEREAFLSLCGEAKTQERIAYMLENNKPLRN